MIVFGIELRRNPTFLIVNILTPIVCLSVLNPVVFLLPHESGERVSFSTTVLLSFTVFLNVIEDNVPKSSNPMPLLCYYVVTQLVSGCVITILAILCQRLQLYYADEPIPKWFAWLFRLNNIRLTASRSGRKDWDDDKIKEINTWQDIIIKLDKLLFLFFFFLAIAVAIGFIITMLNTGMPQYPHSPTLEE